MIVGNVSVVITPSPMELARFMRNGKYRVNWYTLFWTVFYSVGQIGSETKEKER
jgi:hypothetical protein